MLPLAVPKESPFGNVGLIAHVVAVPLVLLLVNDGVAVVMAVWLLAWMSVYAMMPGSPVMWRVKVPVVLAPSAVTVTVNVVLARACVGVPEMVPLRQFMTRPSGSIGEMS